MATKKGATTVWEDQTLADGYFHFSPAILRANHSDMTNSGHFLDGTNVNVSQLMNTQYSNPKFPAIPLKQDSFFATAGGVPPTGRILSFDWKNHWQVAQLEVSGIDFYGNFSTFQVDTTRLWLATISGSNVVLYTWHSGQSGLTARYTGSYGHSGNSNFHAFDGVVNHQISATTGTTIKTLYVTGTTVTEGSTVTVASNNNLAKMSFLSPTYGAGVEVATGTTTSSPQKDFYIYSGTTFTRYHPGNTTFPSSGHRAMYAHPVSTGVLLYGMIHDNDTSVDYYYNYLYSGGSFGTGTARIDSSTTATSFERGVWDPANKTYFGFNTNNSEGVLVTVTGGTMQVATKNCDMSFSNINYNRIWRNNRCVGLGIANSNTTYMAGALSYDMYAPGERVRFWYSHDLGGATTIGPPQNVYLWVYDDNSLTSIWNTTFSPDTSTNFQSGFDFWLTKNGTATGTPIHGSLRLRMRVQRTNVPTYDHDSDTAHADRHLGYIRVGTRVTGLNVNSDANESQTKNPYAYPDTFFFKARTQYEGVLSRTNNTFNVEFVQSGSAVNNVTLSTGLKLFSGSTIVDNSFLVGNMSTKNRIKVSGLSMFNDQWTHFLEPTGSEVVWIDKFTVEAPGTFNVDKRIYIGQSGTAPTNGRFATYHPKNAPAGATLFQVEEPVSGFTYLLNARNEVVTGVSTATGYVSTASGNDTSFVLNHVGNGEFTGMYTIAQGHQAAHNASGQAKKLLLKPNTVNSPTATGSDSWYVTDWWKVDSHLQSGGTLNRDPMTDCEATEQENYIISADLCYWWAHAQNARGETLTSGVQFTFTTLDPEGNFIEQGVRDIQPDGWTEKLNASGKDIGVIRVVPTSPQGDWKFQVLAYKSGSNVSGTYSYSNFSNSPNWGFGWETTPSGTFDNESKFETARFISAFRDNITLETSWGVQGQPGKHPVIGDTLLVGFRVHKDGVGHAVDSGSIPKIKIAKFNQADGKINYIVGTEQIGADMTPVTNVYPSGDAYSWLYTWNTSGQDYGNYVFQVNAKILGAVSFGQGLILVRSGYTLQSDFASHTGQSTAVHGVSGSVVGTSGSQTLHGKTLISPTIDDFTNAQHNHGTPAEGGDLEDAGKNFNPLDFSLFGVHKTYLNPGDEVLSKTHNYIQGLGDNEVTFLYGSGDSVTGMIVDDGTTSNNISMTYSGKYVIQVVETINNKLSGDVRTVTTDYYYSGSNVTGTNTTVS